MTRTCQTSRRRCGVTLIEMMVALAITTFVILIVNKLFNEVVTTVSRGTQAGEILQRSRAFDEQIATETQLQLSDDPDDPANWWGRMVGPAGRDGTSASSSTAAPGGFLAIVQRRVLNVPVTINDAIQGNTTNVRSDQLVFIYDQLPNFDQSGKKRLPPLAPAGLNTYAGDMRDSINADYVRIWYGHVAQLDKNGAYQGDIDNTANADNPNAIAQDWVLGRQALFLTDSSGNTVTGNVPYGPYPNPTFGLPFASTPLVSGYGGSPLLASGLSDVADLTLKQMMDGPTPGALDTLPTLLAYQSSVLNMMYTSQPLLTAAKTTGSGGNLNAWDTAPSSTYFMGGVSDFIVEFAGDLVRGESYTDTNYDPDGELDRDPDGRIKWYTAPAFANTPSTGGYNADYPASYPAPLGDTNYPPGNTGSLVAGLPRAYAALVWRDEPSGNDRTNYTDGDFRQWPWLLRIRYRLHDRRGQFDGRQIINTSTNKQVPEPGEWFEIIVPVNYQGIQ